MSDSRWTLSSYYYFTEPWIMRSDLYRSTHPNCEVCGIPNNMAKRWYGTKLNIHHRNYLRWGRGQELDEDLLALCLRCHCARHYLPVDGMPNYVEYAPWLECEVLCEDLLDPLGWAQWTAPKRRLLDLAKRGHLLAGGVK